MLIVPGATNAALADPPLPWSSRAHGVWRPSANETRQSAEHAWITLEDGDRNGSGDGPGVLGF